jgi:hypothetical protein
LLSYLKFGIWMSIYWIDWLKLNFFAYGRTINMLVVWGFCEVGPFDTKARFFQNWAYVYTVCIMPILCMQKLCVIFINCFYPWFTSWLIYFVPLVVKRGELVYVLYDFFLNMQICLKQMKANWMNSRKVKILIDQVMARSSW